MRLMYGSPPSPGKGRDVVIDQEIVDEVKRQFAAPPPDDTPPWWKFEWNGVGFTWAAGTRFEGAHPDGWSATVIPDGFRWKATIRIAGGGFTELGDFPEVALNNALLAWQQAVSKLKLGDGP